MKCEHGNGIEMEWRLNTQWWEDGVSIRFKGCDQCVGIWVTDHHTEETAIHPVGGEFQDILNDDD
jgi:hypothetical protein|tara:strand:+ start:379 stop:573 length:195 start_codon:yes stop_codon:yes gene_type:complete